MPNFLAPLINEQQIDSNGDPLNAGEIYIYLAGSSTPVVSYSDKAGAIPNTTPILLNTLGINSQGAIWLPGGAAYKFVILNEFGVVQRTIDNVSGINDTTVTTDQWLPFAGTPTYISATSFTVAGDQTPTLQVGRRILTVNTGGTVFSTITASVYGAPNTTVTVVNDSGVLDAGLSQVSYGLISPLDTSLPPGRLTKVVTLTASGTYTRSPGAKSGLVIGIGGGGGGGSSTTTGAANVSTGLGGGSGSCFEHYFAVLPASQAYTIGGAGAGGGGNGGTTIFGSLNAPGGLGGTSVNAPSPYLVTGGPEGAPATGGNILNTQGQQGGQAQALALNAFVSGAGAPSRFGGGGRSLGSSTGGGYGALSPGAGGGGALNGASSPGQTGGAGGAGLILVYEYS